MPRLSVVLSCRGLLVWGNAQWDSAQVELGGGKLVPKARRALDKDSQGRQEGR